MRNRSGYFILAGTVLFLMAVAIEPQRTPQAHGMDGYAWLSWSNEAKEVYLLGFLQGYHRGIVEGCLAADDIAKSVWTINEINACYGRQVSFTRSVDGLRDDMTQFFAQYPADRGLELDVLLRQFSDQKHRSSKEIHALLESKEPL